MTSSRPYLVRAIYEWLVDNQLTPYLMVDAESEGVKVPEQFIEDGKIVLNIAPLAVGNLEMGNDAVDFDASFSGVITHICAPIRAVMAVYAFENGRGMVFDDDDLGDGDDDTDGAVAGAPSGAGKGKPVLKIVK